MSLEVTYICVTYSHGDSTINISKNEKYKHKGITYFEVFKNPRFYYRYYGAIFKNQIPYLKIILDLIIETNILCLQITFIIFRL